MHTSEDGPNLAGIRVGVTKLDDVRRQYGPPEEISYSRPYTAAGGDAGGDLFWDYPSRGIRVVVDRENVGAENPAVDEVAVKEPYDSVVFGGVRIGQNIESAKQFIADHFTIKDTHEDSIYFGLINDCDLLVCVENLDSDKVVSVELMRA